MIDRLKKITGNLGFINGLLQLAFFSSILVVKQIAYHRSNLVQGKVLVLISAAVILLSWTLLLKEKKQFWALIVMDLLVSMVILSDKVYYRYYSAPISIPVLLQVGLMGSLAESIKELFKVTDIVYFIDFLTVIPLIYFTIYKKTKFFTEFTIKKFFVRPIVLVLVLLISRVSIVDRVELLNKVIPGLFKAVFNNNIIENEMGILSFHAFDVYKYVNNNLAHNNLSEEDKKAMANYFEEKNKNTSNNFNGIAKGKNVIIIQVEALQGFVLNREINGVEITPNLNKLAKENIYFNHFFTQVAGGNTSDAEFVTNDSLFPLSEGAIYFRYPGNAYNSLPNILKKEGYTSYVMHPYDPDFWNRKVMYGALGFEKFYDKTAYNIDETVGWGLSDKSFFKQSLEKMEKMPQPFYSFLITLSSHYPFEAFKDTKNLNVGTYEGTFLGNYLKAANYADSAIGGFIEDLKQKGLYDNSVIIIYGDHEAVKSDNYGPLNTFLEVSGQAAQREYKRIPFIIHVPGQDMAKTYDLVGGQVDTLPTLLNLLGIDYKYSLGKDLLNIQDNAVLFRDGSYLTKDVYYSGNEAVKHEDSLKAIKALNISDSIIFNDMFRKQLK